MANESQAYDGITEEEQAALVELEQQLNDAEENDEEFNPENVHKGGEQEQEEEQEQQAAKTPEEQQAETDAKAQADAAAAAAAAEAAKEQQPKPAEQKAQATPYLVAEAPADAEAKLTDIATKKGDLAKQFDDGDVTTAEYQAELDKLNREERTIERQIDRAQLAAELEEQRAVAERDATINTFLASVDIPRDPKNLRFQVLDAAVRNVASDEANAELSAPEIMQKAFDLCVEQGVLQAKQAQPPKQGKTQQEQRAPAKKQVDAPPSLAHMPAAEATDTGENRFAWLAAIRDPDKHEAAFNKLSAADQEAYLAAGG
jgi:DNA repair exonuclease SbcCD ATPase subunit